MSGLSGKIGTPMTTRKKRGAAKRERKWQAVEEAQWKSQNGPVVTRRVGDPAPEMYPAKAEG